jgi:hypothetical protein
MSSSDQALQRPLWEESVAVKRQALPFPPLPFMTASCSLKPSQKGQEVRAQNESQAKSYSP